MDNKQVGLSQGISQQFYFDLYPGDLSTAKEIVKRELNKIKTTCPQHNIELLVLRLFSRCEVSQEYDTGNFSKVDHQSNEEEFNKLH